jgi:hypothetical protein
LNLLHAVRGKLLSSIEIGGFTFTKLPTGSHFPTLALAEIPRLAVRNL